MKMVKLNIHSRNKLNVLQRNAKPKLIKTECVYILLWILDAALSCNPIVKRKLTFPSPETFIFRSVIWSQDGDKYYPPTVYVWLFFNMITDTFFFFFNFFFLNLFIYFWLCWVFVSVRGLSLVAASGGHSSSRCAGLSLSRPVLLRSTGSRPAGSVIVAHGPNCSAACGIFPDQGSNPCLLHWQADSQPLRHQGSPEAWHF